jgi:hypothetical protein
MPSGKRIKKYKKIIIISAIVLFSLFTIFIILADRLIEPILKDKLHTLIIQGSDSLYSYKLGRLSTSLLGGKVEVENLQITIDSNRYAQLEQKRALPSLTMQLNLGRGYIQGVGIISLLFGRKVIVEEILSKDAQIKLSRHIHQIQKVTESKPLWMAIRPKIESIDIKTIRLVGIKMSYKNADTSESVKLKFDRCDAVFKNIRVDSLAAVDTTRIGFTKSINLKFNDLKFRTDDSTYKMKAQEITYSSEKRILEVDSFKLQPTLDKDAFYKNASQQQNIYKVEIDEVRFVNTRLDHFIYNNVIDADSVVFETPRVAIYNDRSLPVNYTSKIGRYPQQELLNASSTVIIRNLSVQSATFSYTEKNPRTQMEGVLSIDNLNIAAHNITNDLNKIKNDPLLTANVQGKILGTSPVTASFNFRLDSTNGSYEATGNILKASASELNKLSVPLADIQLNSFDLQFLEFKIKGSDYGATGDVKMQYNNLFLTIKKTDTTTGVTQTKKFLTKVLNKFVLWPENPMNGSERYAIGKKVSRLTTESFFGLLWKTIFGGMQDIMMKAGRYETDDKGF